MKVFISGGAGYIGSILARRLIAAGHRPVILDTLNWGTGGLDGVRDGIDLVEGDCRSSRDVIYALEGCDSVVHLAGIVGEPACRINNRAHHTINIEATRTLVNCCTDPRLDLIRDFVYVSSCSVYGNVKGLYAEVDESTPASPLSWYADGKLAAEEILTRRAAEVPHFRPTILRLTTVFGWSPRLRLDLVTNMFVLRALREGRIGIWGDGQQYRSLIHVDDVAAAITAVIEAPPFKRDRRVFHVGEERNNRTVEEIANAVAAIVPDTRVEFSPGAPTDRRDYRINCQRIKNAIGWEAHWTLERGVEDLAQRLREDDEDWSDPRFVNDCFDYQ